MTVLCYIFKYVGTVYVYQFILFKFMLALDISFPVQNIFTLTDFANGVLAELLH